MKRVLVICSLFAHICGAFAADLVGIRADKSTATVALSEVQSIIVQKKAAPKMIVTKTDGTEVGEFQTIKFAEMTSGQTMTAASDASIAIYPNPVERVIYIDGADGAIVCIYDEAGRLVEQTRDAEINVEHFTKGLYVVNVNGKKVKFIKK